MRLGPELGAGLGEQGTGQDPALRPHDHPEPVARELVELAACPRRVPHFEEREHPHGPQRGKVGQLLSDPLQEGQDLAEPPLLEPHHADHRQLHREAEALAGGDAEGEIAPELGAQPGEESLDARIGEPRAPGHGRSDRRAAARGLAPGDSAPAPPPAHRGAAPAAGRGHGSRGPGAAPRPRRPGRSPDGRFPRPGRGAAPAPAARLRGWCRNATRCAPPGTPRSRPRRRRAGRPPSRRRDSPGLGLQRAPGRRKARIPPCSGSARRPPRP